MNNIVMEMMIAGGLTHQWLREALGIKPGDLYAHYSFHMNSCKAPALLIV